MISATRAARLAISRGVRSTGGVKSVRVAVTLSAAGEGATADTTFTWPQMTLNNLEQIVWPYRL